MKKLSKYEKETVINWNEAENLASIYTFNASLKRRLSDFSRKYPLLCRLERSTPEGSVTYVIEKSRLSIRLVPPYSEERLPASTCTGYYLTQTFAGFAASPLLPFGETIILPTKKGGIKKIETDQTQRTLRQAWRL